MITFNTGDSVQPKVGGQRMTVVSSDQETVVCTWGIMGEENIREFKASELVLYHEDDDFGVC